MQIKEIEGKEYVEYEVYKKVKERKLISILFLFFLAIAILAMIVAITILVKNKDIIQSDPLRYGMEVHGFVSCQCIDDEGQTWVSEDTGFINRQQGKNYINYSDLIINFSIIDFGDKE